MTMTMQYHIFLTLIVCFLMFTVTAIYELHLTFQSTQLCIFILAYNSLVPNLDEDISTYSLQLVIL